MNNKKILFVVNVDWFFISHRLPIALEALADGYDVYLACKDTGRFQELSDLGLRVYDIPFSRSGNGLISEISCLIALRNLIGNVKPDILHAITIKPVIYSGVLLHSIKRKPKFVAAISGLGYVFSAKTLRAKFTRYLVSFLYKLAFSHLNKLVIFQNTTDEKILTSICKLDIKDKMLIKGSGADLDIYKTCPEPDSDMIKVVMACRLLKEKGVYEFIEAAKVIKSQYENVTFLLAGTPDFDNPNSISQKELTNWDSLGIITALGQCDNIPKLFSESHIVTMPSFYGEGVPKVLIEAAACGRPIVTTNNPGCRDSVIPNETGLLVPIKDHQSLASAIIYLIENKHIRQSMGKKAREYAVKEFDVKSVISKHMHIYNGKAYDDRCYKNNLKG